MNIKIPFESELNFKTNVSEITKMSLEHEFTLNDHVILGNFIVSGEYKSHHICVNTDPFKFLLPFKVDLDNDIKEESVVLDIEDFTYDIVGDKNIKVNIVYSIKGDVLVRDDNLFESVIDVDFESEINHLDEVIEEDDNDEIDFEEEREEEVVEIDNEEETIVDDVVEEIEQEPEIEKREEIPVETKEIKEEVEEKREIAEVDKSAIIDSLNMEEDSFVTYHVHIVKESETIETICAMYKTNQMTLSEYNDISDIVVGDKIIIPEVDE